MIVFLQCQRILKATILVQLQGWSRNFAQTMHAWSQEGKGGYLEEFVPSLAASKNLASVGVANDEYYGPRYARISTRKGDRQLFTDKQLYMICLSCFAHL